MARDKIEIISQGGLNLLETKVGYKNQAKEKKHTATKTDPKNAKTRRNKKMTQHKIIIVIIRRRKLQSKR
jgi:hypothetical protein